METGGPGATPGSKTVPVAMAMAAGWTVALALLFLWNLATTQEGTQEILRAQAAAHFQQVLTTRGWNSVHGGVFVPTTEDSPPNSFLADSLQTETTTRGMLLTRVNPAYMVRQISELAAQRDVVQFRMMSDRPLNPRNTPDPWEQLAMNRFLVGEADAIWELFSDNDEPAFRYVAPLFVEDACLQCHEEQGYSVGDVRGAMSVTVPARPVLQAESVHLRRFLGGYFILWTLGMGGIGFAAFRLKRLEEKRDGAIEELQTALDQVSTLHGLLPICAACQKIRNDDGYWERIETYVEDRSEATFTQGVCPTCTEKLYKREFAEEIGFGKRAGREED
jgi:hypothetical protein